MLTISYVLHNGVKLSDKLPKGRIADCWIADLIRKGYTVNIAPC